MRVPSALIAIAVTLLSLACTSAGRNARAVEGVVPTADGVNLYYKIIGTGPRTIVMPLATWWDPHVTSLTSTYRIVLYDPRDRGRSSEVTNSSSLSLAHEIADLEAVRRHLKIDRMSLVGWSYLGAVVALYAARHPEHVDRIVMVGPIPPRKTPYWSEFVTDLANRKDAMAEAELARAAAAGVQGSDPRKLCVLTWRARVMQALADRAVADRVVNSDICKWPNEWPMNMGFQHVLRSFGDWDWRGESTRVTVPTLVVHGDRDNIPLTGSREWVANLPNSRLLVIRNAGHFPHAENPQEFFVAVGQFLSGRWPLASIAVRREQ